MCCIKYNESVCNAGLIIEPKGIKTKINLMIGRKEKKNPCNTVQSRSYWSRVDGTEF